MTGHEAFSRLVNYMGQGNPKDALCFIGIEGGDSENIAEKVPKDLTDAFDKEEFYKILLGSLYEGQSDWIENANPSKPYSPMWIVSSKIGIGLSEGGEEIDWKDKSNWEKYLLEVHGKVGSKTSFTNIFPLEKKNLLSRHSKELYNLLDLEGVDEYFKVVEEKRFQLLNSIQQGENKPQATICYGKGRNEEYWNKFKSIFELSEEEQVKYGNFLITYPKQKIILTKHLSFAYSHKLIEKVIEILKEWDVQLPQLIT